MNILFLDSVHVLQFFILQAEELGHTINQVFNIREATPIYSGFDLMICNVNLNESGDGFNFYNQIKNSFSGKFILTSGTPDYEKLAAKREISFVCKNSSRYTDLNEFIKLIEL